jgi:sec-independent protein translocase protein TatA
VPPRPVDTWLAGSRSTGNLANGYEKEEAMFGIGIPELIIILVIILIIFGAGKLPEIGAGIGKGIRNFKKATLEDESGQEKIEKIEHHKEDKKDA